MAVGVMAGPSDPLTSEELSNLEEGKAGVVGEDAVALADEGFHQGDVDDVLTMVDDSKPLFTHEEYDGANGDDRTEMEEYAEKTLGYLHENGHVELEEGDSLPEGESAHHAATTLPSEVQHAVIKAVLHKEDNPDQEEIQAQHRENVAKKVKDHKLTNLHKHLQEQHKQKHEHGHQGPTEHHGAAPSHNVKHHPTSDPTNSPLHKSPSAHHGGTPPHDSNEKKKHAASGAPQSPGKEKGSHH
jgi:hypothetical protein